MQQRSEETRAQILQTALGLFSKNGYPATGVAEICRAAGVSKGAFYHHFPSKQAVFQALLEDWLDHLNRTMTGLLDGASDVPTGLLRLVTVMGPVFHDASGQLPMFLEFWTQSSRDPILWQTAIAPYHNFEAMFASAIEKGIAEGSLRPVDARAAAQTLMALAIGVILQGVMDPNGAAWDEVAQQGIGLLLHSLLPVKGGQS
jgi:AcrR family transcriptional regulator